MKRVYYCDDCINKEEKCKATCSNYVLTPSYKIKIRNKR